MAQPLEKLGNYQGLIKFDTKVYNSYILTPTDLNKHHHKVCSYLRCMDDEDLRWLGGALGLTYPKLRRMAVFPNNMVAAWLREEDNVEGVGHPSWFTLVKELKKMGQTGVAKNITENGNYPEE